MAPATAQQQRRGANGEDAKAVRVAELRALLEWAAHERLQSTVQALADQLAALGEAMPTEGALGHRLFLSGFDNAAALSETPEDFAEILGVLDSHLELFESLGAEGRRQHFEARVAVMRQAAVAALRGCLPANIEEDGWDPRALAPEDVVLQPYWKILDDYFPEKATPGSALRGRSSPGGAAASAAAAAGHMTAEEQEEAYRKELMRNARRELNSVAEGRHASIPRCLVVLRLTSKPAFVAEVRAMTRRLEMKLLGKPKGPRPERGLDPAGVARRLEGRVEMWAQDKAAGASAHKFQRLGRGHMRTLVAAAQQVAEETDTDDEGEQQLHRETAGLKQQGAHGGGAGGGGRPRYNDPSRPGRQVAFEDSQYQGDGSEGSGDDDLEDKRLPIKRRSKHSATAAAAAAATGSRSGSGRGGGGGDGASSAAKRRRGTGKATEEEEEEEEGEDSDENAEGMDTDDVSDSSGDDGDGGGAGGKGKGKKPYAGQRDRKQVAQKVVLGVSRRPAPKRKRVPWREEEVEALIAAVGQGLRGDWAAILKSPRYADKFDASRTSVDLKDKWRNLEKAKNKK